MVRVSPAPGGSSQRIEFIGTVVGTFDLRGYLERDDGKPLTDLAPLQVSVASQLPADAGTDLYSSEQSWFNWRAHYRTLLWGAVALWAITPFAYWLVRRMQRPAPIAPPETLAGQSPGCFWSRRCTWPIEWPNPGAASRGKWIRPPRMWGKCYSVA